MDSLLLILFSLKLYLMNSSKILQEEGIAGQRKAIIEGYKDNINEFMKNTYLSSKDVLSFLSNTKEIDMKGQFSEKR